MSAESTYISALFGIIATVVWAGSVDLTLYYRDELTISAWLRLHPLWFLTPLAATLIFTAALILHLFIPLFTEAKHVPPVGLRGPDERNAAN
jgi:hypothetical protein